MFIHNCDDGITARRLQSVHLGIKSLTGSHTEGVISSIIRQTCRLTFPRWQFNLQGTGTALYEIGMSFQRFVVSD
jgi:hypothetical protein